MSLFLKKNLTIVIILLASTFIGLSINLLNLSYAKSEESRTGIQHTYQGITINSPDNEFYLSQVENYLGGKGWRQSPPVGKGSYFRRVPGYSIVYFAFRNFLDLNNALRWLKVFQFLLFVTSVLLFYNTLKLLKAGKYSLTLLTLIYGCTPFFSSYTFFTLTESISPFIVVFFTYFLVAAIKGNSKQALGNFVIASFFIGYGTLTRPYLGALLILLFVIPWLYYNNIGVRNRFYKTVIIVFIPLSMLSLWAIRNYIITKRFVPLEVAYYPENLDRMKPEFKAFWNFTRCWAEDGSVMNSYHLPFYFAALKGDTSNQFIDNIVQSVPLDIRSILSEEKIRNAIINYRGILLQQRKYFDNNIAMPENYSTSQIMVASQFNDLTDAYKNASPFNYYILYPIKYLRDVVIHSNTSNLLIFQSPYREKNLVINIFRYVLVAIHVMLYVSVFFNMFYYRKDLVGFLIFSAVPLFFILFFTVFIQAIEQRYMLPILPIIVISNYQIMDKLFLGLVKRK